MAITKIWKHKRLEKRGKVQSDIRKSLSDGIYYVVNPEKTTDETMSRMIRAEPDGISAQVYESVLKGVDYASNEEKTKKKAEEENCFCRDDDCRFVTGVNCSSSVDAIDEFLMTKEQWDDLEPEITHFHGVQSFKGHECSPETAHEIGVELARRLWGDRFQVVVCTHVNTENVHNHFIVNATSFIDGKRFYDNHQSYYKMRYENDILCKKYGLSVVDSDKSRKTHGRAYHYYQLGKQGAPTRLNIAKAALDIAIEKASTLQELEDILYEMEYECDFSPNHKHWTIRSFGWYSPVRLYQIAKEYGDAYNKEGILYRLDEDKTAALEKADKAFPDLVPNGDKVRKCRIDATKESYKKKRLVAFGIQGYYLRYLYLMGVLPRRKIRYSAKYAAMVDYRTRDDVLNVRDILEESKILNRHHIHTEEELTAYREKIKADIKQLTKEAGKKSLTPDEVSLLREELKKLRKEIRHCDNILTRSRRICAKTQAQHLQKNEDGAYGNSGYDGDKYTDDRKINF